MDSQPDATATTAVTGYRPCHVTGINFSDPSHSSLHCPSSPHTQGIPTDIPLPPVAMTLFAGNPVHPPWP